MKKGKWSKEEDSLMKSHIERHGIGRSWQALSNTLGLRRCGRSCRSRWLNYLRPGLKHGNFSPAEERIICDMYSQRGSCWSTIAEQLPGRTDLAVKNYWNSTLKKRFPAVRGRARRRRRPAASASSSDDDADALAVVFYSEESATAGSPSSLAGVVDKPPVLAGAPSLAAADAGNAAKEEPIDAVPIAVSGPAAMVGQKLAVGSLLPLEKAAAPPAGDRTGEMGMGIVSWEAMSPLPLPPMEEPELAWITDFDDIDSFLSYFDG